MTVGDKGRIKDQLGDYPDTLGKKLVRLGLGWKQLKWGVVILWFYFKGGA